MKKILTLIDGSQYASPACDYTAWMAGDAEVELLHVIEKPQAVADDHSGAIRLGARTKLLEELAALDHERAKIQLQHGRAILDDAQALLKKSKIDAGENLRHGDIVDALQDVDHDMLIIGKRGEYTDIESGHLGSNLDRVLSASKTPIFVVNRSFVNIKNVLVAYDGEASADRLVTLLAENPIYLGAKAILVHVGEDGLNIRAIKSGEVGDVLHDMIVSDDIHMLAMGTNTHSRLRSFFVNTSSTNTLLSTHVSVLISK